METTKDGIKIGYNELLEIITNSVLKCCEDDLRMSTLMNAPDLHNDDWLLGKAVEGNAMHIAYSVVSGLKEHMPTQLVLLDDHGSGQEMPLP